MRENLVADDGRRTQTPDWLMIRPRPDTDDDDRSKTPDIPDFDQDVDSRVQALPEDVTQYSRLAQLVYLSSI